MLLTTRQHVILTALAAGVQPDPPLVHDDVQNELLALQATLAAAPVVPGGSKYLLALDDKGLALVGVLVSSRLVHLLDNGIDSPTVQAVHDQIVTLAGFDDPAQPSMADLAAPSEGRER